MQNLNVMSCTLGIRLSGSLLTFLAYTALLAHAAASICLLPNSPVRSRARIYAYALLGKMLLDLCLVLHVRALGSTAISDSADCLTKSCAAAILLENTATSGCHLQTCPQLTGVLLSGHVGFLGRSGVFLFVAVLMFRTISNPNINSTDETTIGNALSQLQKTHGGRAGLFILGFLLLIYGMFAVSKVAALPLFAGPAVPGQCDVVMLLTYLTVIALAPLYLQGYGTFCGCAVIWS